MYRRRPLRQSRCLALAERRADRLAQVAAAPFERPALRQELLRDRDEQAQYRIQQREADRDIEHGVVHRRGSPSRSA